MESKQWLTVDLHRHLEGSIRPETIFELKDNDPEFQGWSLEQFKDAMIIQDKADNLVDFIGKLGTRFMKAVTKTPADTYRFAYECFEDAAKDNLEVLEVRFCVPNFPKEHLPEIYQARHDIEKKYPIKVGLIQALLRNYSDEINQRLTQIAIKDYEKEEIVGVDLAGPEHEIPNAHFSNFFDKLFAAGLPITIHAGEAFGAENILTAVEKLHAKRIGHGTSAIESPQVMDKLVEENILVEVCITSNYQTGAITDISQHPVRTFLDHQIPVAICTDDPITSKIKLSTEENLVKEFYGVDNFELSQINQQAKLSSFVK